MVPQTCPQCAADIRLAGVRCKSCGFWLPATPAPRTGPPTARPPQAVKDERRQVVMVLSVGGFVVLGLLAAGAVTWLRQPANVGVAAPVAVARAAPVQSAPPRPEPSRILVAARRQASVWHRDAVLVSLSAGPLDAQGVAIGGRVEIDYAQPAGERLSGGAETSSEHLRLSSSGAELTERQEQAAKARLVPEPNCPFERAWAVVQGAGDNAEGAPSLHYGWSDKHARPIWELYRNDQVVRRLDGVTCSILTR